MVMEGGNVRLTCKAVGRPDPNVTWRREDGRDIILKDPIEHKIIGETLLGRRVAPVNKEILTRRQNTDRLKILALPRTPL